MKGAKQGFFKGLGWMEGRGEGRGGGLEFAAPLLEGMEKNITLPFPVHRMCLNDVLIPDTSIRFMLSKVQCHDWLVPTQAFPAAEQVRPTRAALVSAFSRSFP